MSLNTLRASHRRIASAVRGPPPLVSRGVATASWAEKLLSLLLIAASLALGVAVVGALMRPYIPAMNVALQPKLGSGKLAQHGCALHS